MAIRADPETIWRTLIGGLLLTAEERRRLTVIFQMFDLGDLTTAPVLEAGTRQPFPAEVGTATSSTAWGGGGGGYIRASLTASCMHAC